MSSLISSYSSKQTLGGSWKPNSTHLGFQENLFQEYPVKYLTACRFWESGPQGLSTKPSAILDKFGYCYSEKADPCSNSKKPQGHSAGSGPTGKRKAALFTVPWCHPPVYVPLMEQLAAIFQPVLLTSILSASCTVHCSHFAVPLDHPADVAHR